MAYSYLDGTMTGNLLSGQPVAPTSAPGNYQPGQGTAPYTDLGVTGQAATSSGANNEALNYIQGKISSATNPADAQWWQMKAASVASGHDFFIPGYTGGFGSSGGSTYSEVPAYQYPGSAPSGSTGGDGGLTVIGQSDGWMSPEELRAQTNNIQTGLSGSSLGSGGGGGSGGGSGGSSGSLFGNQQFTPGSQQALNGGSSGVDSFGNPISYNTTPFGYQSPLGAQNPGTIGGNLAMSTANPQSAIDQYKNTAGYQLLNAPGAYQASPGYQYAVDQALGQVQRGAASRGLLDSGRVIRDMQNTASNLALQDYGNWYNRQSQDYNNYQNRLQGLSAGPTGAEQAYNLGQNQAAGTYQTGSNVASLFGNQGTTGLSTIGNTAAAVANNIQNAGNQQAQINAANQSTQLAGATLSGQNRGLF
jgi:hypothetical protein